MSEISSMSPKTDEITLKFIEKYKSFAEIIILKKRFEGWEEINRTMTSEGKDNSLEVINVTIKKIPILQGIRQKPWKN